jgi:hypothetical protein
MATIKASKALKAAMATEFRHRLELLLCGPDGDYQARVNLDVRLMTAAKWKRLVKADELREDGKRVGRYEWSGAELDGGMVLAIRGVDHMNKYRVTQQHETPFPERTEGMHSLRARLFDFLCREQEGKGGPDVYVGAEGNATFRVEIDVADRHSTAIAKVILTHDDNC